MAANPAAGHRTRPWLPLLTLYLTERCNSRCLTCDYWRHGRLDMTLESVRGLLPSLKELDTRLVLLSGGEPLLHPEWADIAALLRSAGLDVWLLTSGLSLAKHARQVAELFSAVTVSLDGTDRATYRAIRGLDAFDVVCGGVRALEGRGLAPGIRVTLQRANYRQLPAFVDLTKRLGARQVSFLAVDVANPHAFGRLDDYAADVALRSEDLPLFAQLLDALEREHAKDFSSGLIAESPAKLRRIAQYFAALHGLAQYPQVRCNAPEFSAVIAADGRLQPCFFIAAPSGARRHGDLLEELVSASMSELRENIRGGGRAECKTCVCSMWRDPGAFEGVARRPAPRAVN